MLICIGIFLVLSKKYFLLSLPIILWIIVERVFWKNFYLGKRLLYKRRYKSSVEHFNMFLNDIEDKPWLSYLRMFNIGVYTHNLKAKVYNNIGICYLESKAFNKAEEYFNKAIEEDNKFCLPYYNLAIIYLIKDDELKARDYLTDAIKKGYNRVKLAQLKGYVMLKYKNR
ncbi:tetratricopeptide repeat protein [Tepidibacter thalassicus]|uniref:Tetratricopeptide repeat-containing protein n=1 Tax=Tepidibacter thalassicus DSM 15285 TaxID=1123350 RepID=A0A1M5RZW5_9FIRM|nr:tetratricopeptide repeat protein [Tepidibacter thalassicus]SHH31734.1 Tetratricopeptide repeat-containing protein [Tepidibacter thalassicus DSM 15285]